MATFHGEMCLTEPSRDLWHYRHTNKLRPLQMNTILIFTQRLFGWRKCGQKGHWEQFQCSCSMHQNKILFFISLIRSAPRRIKLIGRWVSDCFYLGVPQGVSHSWPKVFYQKINESFPCTQYSLPEMNHISPFSIPFIFRDILFFCIIFKGTGFRDFSRFSSQLYWFLAGWLLKTVENLLNLSFHVFKLGIIKTYSISFRQI